MKAYKPSPLFAMFPCRNTDNKSRPVSMPAPRQRGVVLVFSLITLLVLTLLSINMIQQNRLEFMMAGNAQTQTEAFTTAEDILHVTEDYINTLHANNSEECRLVPPAGGCLDNNGVGVSCSSPFVVTPSTLTYNCFNWGGSQYDVPDNRTIATDGIDGNLVVTLPVIPAGRAIPSVLYRCYTTDGKFTQLQASDVGADMAPPWDITSLLSLNSAKIGATEVSITSVACISDTGTEGVCQYDVAGDVLDIIPCHSANLAYCLTQLYTLQVVSKTPGTSAERTTESKYAVRCDADAGPKP